MNDALRSLVWLLTVCLATLGHGAASGKIRPQPDYERPVPGQLTGTVFLDRNRNGLREKGEPGIKSISVSDGYSVVSSDGNGVYTLKASPKAVFIVVTRPTGYDVVGDWYKPASENADFALSPSGKDESSFSFIHVTDGHLSDVKASLDGLETFVREVNALSPPPSFVMNTGDTIELDMRLKTPESTARRWYETFARISDKLDIPQYGSLGNHDHAGYRLDRFPPGDTRCGKAMFWEFRGPNLYSFEYGQVHFVAMDPFSYPASGTLAHQVLPEYVEWFRQDIAHRTPGTIVVTASHVPIHGRIPDFAALAKQNDIVFQLTGCSHILQYYPAIVPYRIGGSLCGNWWNSGCSDLAPRGYLVYRVQGKELSCFYKGLGEQVSITAPAYGCPVKGTVAIQARLIQGKSQGPLEYSVNNGPWTPLAKSRSSPYCDDYRAPWNSSLLPDGSAELAVRAADKQEVRKSVFLIDNGTDFTAAETAALSFAVGYVPGINKFPAAPVTLGWNGKDIGVIAGGREKYTISLPREGLKKVNRLTFKFSRDKDGFVIRDLVLTYGHKILSDPYAEAVRQTRARNWSKEIVEKSGFAIGYLADISTFGIPREEFYFVLPDN